MKCLISVLCLVRRPVTTLDCVLLKDISSGLGPEINSRACLWVLPRPRYLAKCCLSIQIFIFLLIFCLETPPPRTVRVQQAFEQNRFLWTLYLREQGCEDPWVLFEAKSIPPANSLGNTACIIWVFFCSKCCVLSGRGLCDEPITRPEKSY